MNGNAVEKMKVSYELHVQSKDRWNIERIYKGHQKKDVIEDARLLNAEPHIQAVKMVRETYNESDKFSSEVASELRRAILVVDKANADMMARVAEIRQEPKAAPKPQGGISRHTKAKSKNMGP